MELNKFLREKMGKCWHETWYRHNGTSSIECWKCRAIAPYDEGLHVYDFENPSYSTSAEAYLRELIPWAMEQGWWGDFRARFRHLDDGKPYLYCHFDEVVLSPERGAPLIAEFLGYKK